MKKLTFLFLILFLFLGFSCKNSKNKKEHQSVQESTRRARPSDSKREGRRYPHGTTRLHRASKSGNTNEVKSLLKFEKADPNARNDHEQTPLHFASRGNFGYGNGDIVKLLLDAGADPNVRDRHGYLPLFIAIDFARPDVVRALVEGGADIRLKSKKDNLGSTPLMHAKNVKGWGYKNPKETIQEVIDILEEAIKKQDSKQSPNPHL